MSTPNIRPLNDWMLVKVDAPEPVSDTIIIVAPENAPLRKGTVVRVGPGRNKLKVKDRKDTRYIPTQVKPKDRIVFFAAAMGTKQGKQLAYNLPDNYGLLREEDVLFVFEGDVKVEL